MVLAPRMRFSVPVISQSETTKNKVDCFITVCCDLQKIYVTLEGTVILDTYHVHVHDDGCGHHDLHLNFLYELQIQS